MTPLRPRLLGARLCLWAALLFHLVGTLFTDLAAYLDPTLTEWGGEGWRS